MAYPTDPMMTAARRRIPVFRPQMQGQPMPQNGLAQLGQGYAPPEGPPMQQPGYLPQEPGAYQQPGYNTGIVPPGFNQRPMPGFNFGDANHLAGYNGSPFTQPSKGGTMGFTDGRPSFNQPQGGFNPQSRPWWMHLNGPGGG